MAAAASSSAGKEALTRLSMPLKDAALEAAKRAKPQWHLIDAKDRVPFLFFFVFLFVFFFVGACERVGGVGAGAIGLGWEGRSLSHAGYSITPTPYVY